MHTVSNLLRHRCYRGDFTLNTKHQGQFHGVNADGDVVPAAELNGKRKVFVVEGCYKAIVDPDLFDKAQQRLQRISKAVTQRKREYVLSGIMTCGHCGSPLYGCRPKGDGTPAVYRCGSYRAVGQGICGYRVIREDAALPFLMRLLGEEITDLRTPLTNPPEDLAEPHKRRACQRKDREADYARMEAQIGGAQENLLACDDPRTFKSLSARITTMRDELDRLKAELTVPEIVHTGMTEAEYDALDRWYADLYRRSVTVLVPKNRKAPWPAHAMPDSDRLHMPADARLINEALITLGVKVKLWWKATGGTPYKRHQVAKGSFEIGEKSGQIEGDNFTAPVCRRAGRRCRCRPL